MRILMTGATGLIGKEVGKLLVNAGHDLTIVSRNPDRARRELPFPARVLSWKGHEEPFPLEALRGQEAIVHLAGEPIAEGRWTDARKKAIRASRIVGTHRLVEAILNDPEAASSLQTFVLGSAIGYYGHRGDEILTEEAPRGKGFLADVVEAWEVEAEALRLRPKTRIVKVRTGVVLSRRGGALAKMLPLFTRGLGGKLGKGQQWMSWIHIKDIARLFQFCVENEAMEGVVNGVAPEPARNERFTLELARAVGRQVSLPVPETALKLALGEMASAALESQRVAPTRATAAGFQFHFPELVSSLRELGEPLKDAHHELVNEQWVPRTPEEIFPFFCDEANLERITPPLVGFHVLGKNTPTIGEGTLIDYQLKVHGVPVKWQTRIEKWEPNKGFVDAQLSGPYQSWYHTHEFVPMCGGTLLRDRVLYKLPFGYVGDAAGSWLVSRDVHEIFNYRRKVIDGLFGASAERDAKQGGVQ